MNAKKRFNPLLLAVWFVVSLMLPVILLAFTEKNPLWITVAGILLPLGFYLSFISLSKRSGRMVWAGFIFVFLEIFINVQANFNTIIVHSFHGNIEAAIAEADYLWLMFYPCLYFFAMYDAFRDAGGGQKPYSFFPFVFCAYFVTVGTIYSPIFKIFDVYIGPVWLPILSVTPGLLVGLSLQSFFRNRLAQN